MLAFLILCILLLASMGTLHWYWNRKRDLQDQQDRDSEYSSNCFLQKLTSCSFTDGVPHVVVENEEFSDKTDFQLRSFRYPI